ncbi:hypothetical protein A1O1_06554 [Capronia coronata CBS 617.96]|uniref:Uncharacterized protein n=1 Tax=Capronia coronata CBS 617.96 TaxID=1182541 RepID=W9YV75_9EURO|nr:uncharacterized protein A1O1_06554 [Capronia coronata CBS 617.96]EXJ86184.1 hypothetical protein A1O1_06554 [Capronia coronata CBS 617.96]
MSTHLPLDETQNKLPTLRHLISDGSFWTLPEVPLLQTIQREFPSELQRLKNATFLRDPTVPRPTQDKSMSESLYSQDYAEINRTLVGILALRWLWNDDYQTFIGTRTQGPRSIILKRSSFDWIRDIFLNGLQSANDIYTLITSMVINDLGKDPGLATDYARVTGIDISHLNHDMVLYRVAKSDVEVEVDVEAGAGAGAGAGVEVEVGGGGGLIPALHKSRLTPSHRELLLAGIKLGSEFNFGQLAQAENAPASLAGLLELRRHDRNHDHARPNGDNNSTGGGNVIDQALSFEMRFMEQILDLAGSAGHEDCTCAKKMTEPVFQSYRNVYDVADAIIGWPQQQPESDREAGNQDQQKQSEKEKDRRKETQKITSLSLRQAYDIILTRKLQLLHDAGYCRPFDITCPRDRAIMRLFCLGNTTDGDTADVFFVAFAEYVSRETRRMLTYGLNLDGGVDEPAVQPTYFPAMLTKALRNTEIGNENGTDTALAPDAGTDTGTGTPQQNNSKIKTVAAMLRYLARCLVVDQAVLEKLPKGVTVIERDVRGIADVVESEAFRRDPDVLDEQAIPGGQVANMALEDQVQV